MKKLLLTMLLMLPLCSILADDEPNAMIVKMKNGTTVCYAFADMPKVTIEGTDLVVTAHLYTAQHPLSDVQRYEFKNNPSGIEGVTIDGAISREGDIFSVSGKKAGESVSIFNTAGTLVTSSKTDANGCATVSLASLPTGIYVLSFNGCSTKIMKR